MSPKRKRTRGGRHHADDDQAKVDDNATYYADHREALLRRFSMPTCAELRERLSGPDAGLADDAKLKIITEHESGLRDLCRVVAGERRAQGARAVDGLLDVAAATVHQMRIGLLSYGEQMLMHSGAAAAHAAAFDDCVRAMRLGTDCEALWALRRELEGRLQRTPGWSGRVWTLVNRGLQVAQAGGKIVLSTVTDGVVAVLRSTWALFQALLPYIIRLASYVFSSPKAALLAFLYAKHLQRNLCRFVSRMVLLRGLPVPPAEEDANGGFPAQVRRMAAHGGEYFNHVALGTFVEGIGGVVRSTLVDNVDGLVSGGVTLAASMVPGGALVAPFVGKLIAGAVKAGAEVVSDTAEHAVFMTDADNAFTKLYEVLSFGECARIWALTRARASAARPALGAVPRSLEEAAAVN